MVKIRWFGHACFEIVSSQGTRLLTDPFDETIGYAYPRVEVDVVTISHGHFDHDCTRFLPGHPRIVRDEGSVQFKDILITGVPSYHDNAGGKNRGPNIMFSFGMDGLQLAHLGDLGHMLGPEHVLALGHPQVVLVPVGGTYTIDARQATRVVQVLASRVVIPMHYKTEALSFPLDTVDDFLQDKKRVRRVKYSTVDFTPENLPDEQEVIVLSYA